MRQIVTVQALLEGGYAEVICQRQSACSGDCHKCAGCGAAAETVMVVAENALGAQPGDRVYVESGSKEVLKVTAILYLAPIALFFLGFFLGTAVAWPPALTGGFGFLAGLGLAFWYDRRLEKKKTVQYKIIGYAES